MHSAKQNAAQIVSFLTEALNLDAVIRDLYRDFEFTLTEHDTGCDVRVSDATIAHCYADGSIDIGPSVLETIKGLRPVPVLTPLTKETFKLALTYYTEMRLLGKAYNNQLILLKLGKFQPFESGGLWC